MCKEGWCVRLGNRKEGTGNILKWEDKLGQGVGGL